MERMARIKVIEAYAGYITTGGNRISLGEYDVNDPALHGQAEFLVSTGRAVVTATYAEPVLPPAVKQALEGAIAANAANPPQEPAESEDDDEGDEDSEPATPAEPAADQQPEAPEPVADAEPDVMASKKRK